MGKLDLDMGKLDFDIVKLDFDIGKIEVYSTSNCLVNYILKQEFMLKLS